MDRRLAGSGGARRAAAVRVRGLRSAACRPSACSARAARRSCRRSRPTRARAVSSTARTRARAREPGPLDAAVAAVWLEPPVSDWIHAFKYPPRGLRGLAPGPIAAVAELAARSARRAPGPAPDLVVPVPLHPRRLRARGFNPALVVARAVARCAGAPVAATALERVRDTPSQTGLDAAARRRNVRGALRARRSRARRASGSSTT